MGSSTSRLHRENVEPALTIMQMPKTLLVLLLIAMSTGAAAEWVGAAMGK